MHGYYDKLDCCFLQYMLDVTYKFTYEFITFLSFCV